MAKPKRSWNITNLRSNLKKVIELAIEVQPQEIEIAGKTKAVIISVEMYEELTKEAANAHTVQRMWQDYDKFRLKNRDDDDEDLPRQDFTKRF